MPPASTPESASTITRSDAGSEPSATRIVAEMASDVRRLGESYLELLRLEVAQALRKAAQVAVAGVLATLGLVLLAVGIALVLAENTDLSSGAAYGLVGGVLCVAGGAWAAFTVRERERRGP
jgi:hypothetical protein